MKPPAVGTPLPKKWQAPLLRDGVPNSASRPDGSGLVSLVQPDSPAYAAGLRAGDTLLSINGHALRDVIDYHFYGAEEDLEITFKRGGKKATVNIERPYGEDLGLEFSALTFDGIRLCENQCGFCFVQQMPKGLRKSLYIRDDDYRYSFLMGNFVTLTNLDKGDWARLKEQRLSPLYVSVHATDRELRSQILGTGSAPDILEQIQRLGRAGIEVHTQIVLLPGVNDGLTLQRTVHDLAALHPTVASIAMVPIGLTRYHSCGLRSLTPQEAKDVLAFTRSVRPRFRHSTGVGLLYPSDELYLLAGQRLPSARSYDGYPQLANGVGLVRQLLEDWGRAKRRDCLGHRDQRAAWHHAMVTLVCGTLIAPTLQALSAELAEMVGTKVQVVPVANQFFGPTVTVSGLLLAQDVIAAVQGMDLGQVLVLPRAMFDDAGNVTLDDYSLADIERKLGVPVTLAETLSEVIEALGSLGCRTWRPSRPDGT